MKMPAASGPISPAGIGSCSKYAASRTDGGRKAAALTGSAIAQAKAASVMAMPSEAQTAIGRRSSQTSRG